MTLFFVVWTDFVITDRSILSFLNVGYSVLIFMLVCVTLSSQTSTQSNLLSVPALSSYPGYPLTQSRKSSPLIAVKLSSIKRSPVNIAWYGYEINVPHLPEKINSSRVIQGIFFSWSSLKSLRGHL